MAGTPSTDGSGFLAVHDDRPTPMATTMFGPDGRRRTYFQQSALEAALWAFGEDGALGVVRAGLGRAAVEAIGDKHADLLTKPDPARRSGHGFAFDQALAMAAVEVLEGTARPLARTRRRSNK